MGIKVRHNGQWVEMGFAGAPGGEPVGTIIAWGGSAANIPSNFRLCDGQALSRTTYSDLFSKLGTIHGSGDGSTTFNIPDLRSRFIVGAHDVTGEGSWPSVGVGSTGGSADAVVVQHQHTAGTLTGVATDRYFAGGYSGQAMHFDGHHSDRHGKYTNVTRNVTITGSTANEGVSGTNENLPPYYALCYIIKIDTSSATGSGVADGDYGDITVSNSGTVWNIDQNTIGPTELIATGVSAGSYTNANISVDEDGRITAASSGSAPVTTFLGLSDTPNTYVPSAGKVLVVNNTQNGVEFVDKSAITSGFSTDKISEGNTEAEVVDTNGNGHFKVTTEGTERLRVTSDGNVGIGSTTAREKLDISAGRIILDQGYQLTWANGSTNTARIHGDSGNNFIIENGSSNTERLRIGSSGQIGLSGANYGTPGQVLVSAGANAAPSWQNASSVGAGATDKISEGDSKAEIIDTATESKLTVEIDATEKVSISTAGPRIHRQDNSLEGGSISFTRAIDDALAFEIDVYGPSSSNSNRFRIVDQSISGGVERFAIGPNGEIGLGYVSHTSADYGTAGQVLTSGGPGVGATWADASGGGGSSDPVGTIVAWAGSVASIPSEYQLCDGGAAATSELAAITGTNVPDLRERFVIGAGGDNLTVAGSAGYNVGATGGANTVTLTLNQIPAHNHFDSTSNGGASGISQWGLDPDGNNNPLRVLTEDGPPYNGIVGNLSRGGGQAHENRPPYYALCYIIKHTATSGSGGSSGDKISEGNTEAEVVDTNGNGHFKVTTEGTERLRITSNGNVGINTNSPDPYFHLDVNGNIALTEGQVLTWHDRSGNKAGDIYMDSSDNFVIRNTDNVTERFRITSNGSVGIGTSIPEGGLNPNPLFGTKLDVFKSFVGGGDGSFVGRFYGLDTNVQETSVRFVTKGTGGNAADLHNASDAYLMHGISNGDTKFVFGSNGNVGIGTTNPNVAVDSTNTAKLAVGIVTCHELYVNGTQITGSGSGGSSDPVGTIVAWAGSVASIPSEYQLCDGLEAQTSALSAITGTYVPDLRSRFIVGAHDVTGEGSWPSVGVGSTGGSADATLVSHSHTTNSTLEESSNTAKSLTGSFRNEAHGGGTTGIFTQQSQNYNEDSSQGNNGYTVSIDATHRHGTDSQGDPATNANLPPYYALCYIIKHTATASSGSSSGGGITLLPEQTIDSTAQTTSVEFTNIPADALEITVMFEGVSLSGTNNFEIQLGTASGYIVSNYDSLSQDESGSNESTSISGFILRFDHANRIRTGSMLIKKASSTSYVQTGQFAAGPNTGTSNPILGGSQTYGSLSSVSGTVDRLRIKPNGTNTFDAGLISVSYKTATSGSGSSSGGSGGTVSSGTFTATAGSPSTLESYTYDSAELVFEYTVFVKNGSNYQTQKLLVMRDGTTVDSSQFAVMYSNNLLVQLDATISGSNLLLRATPETGVNGSTTYRIKREVM